jgi:hypothetical protein
VQVPSKAMTVAVLLAGGVVVGAALLGAVEVLLDVAVCLSGGAATAPISNAPRPGLRRDDPHKSDAARSTDAVGTCRPGSVARCSGSGSLARQTTALPPRPSTARWPATSR